jgi:hypothetical protein
MTQLDLFYPPKIPLDGRIVCDREGIVVVGDGYFSHGAGFYRCLAQVGQALCVVEVKITIEWEKNIVTDRISVCKKELR